MRHASRKAAGSKSILWLWTTVIFRNEAEALIKAWGFNRKSEIVWNKVCMGMGNYARVQHEILLIANRGGQLTRTNTLRSVINEKRGKHSAKPESFRRLVEANSPAPMLELFARSRTAGWTSFGNQDQTPNSQ
jgi:N6-adenosine-specific RNA methylase IME4